MAMINRIIRIMKPDKALSKLIGLLGNKAFIPKAITPYSIALNKRLAVFSFLL
ncbi:MAG: hypothetical protein AABY52_05230 [Deltaproteobacteria bacterium]